MSETTDLAVLDIKPEQAPALYVPNGLDAYLEQIRQAVSEVPDLSTAKGRARVASLSAQVSRSKTAIEKPGREYLKRLKEAVKPAEVEIKRFVDACDVLRDEVRKPLTEWEAEQARIAAEKEAEEERKRIEAEQQAATEALKKQIEADHEIALLLNEKFDRDAAEARAEAERQRIAHEEELKLQAAERARIEFEKKLQHEREEAARREVELKEKAEQAERDRLGAIKQAEEFNRQREEAIAAEQLKQKEAEQRRLAEEKRIADEVAARAANEAHRKAVGTAVVNALMANAGLTRVQAIDVLTQIKDGNIPHTAITY